MPENDKNTDNFQSGYDYNPNRPQNHSQDDTHEDTKKVVNTAAKGAAEYFAPGVGAKAYDIAKNVPGVGGTIDSVTENLAKQADAIPGVSNVTKGLNDAGVTDLADKAIDTIGQNNVGKTNALLNNKPKTNISTKSSDNSIATPTGALPSNSFKKNAFFNNRMANDLANEEENLEQDNFNEADDINENLDESNGSLNLTNDNNLDIEPPEDNKKDEKKDDKLTEALKNPFKSYWDRHKIAICLSALGILFFILIILCAAFISENQRSTSLLSTYISCDTITIINPDNTEETLDFEYYIAGVVTAESGRADFPEASKAQAIIARTYAIKNTNYCTTPIENSTNRQVYSEPNEFGIEMAEATKGIIIVDKDDTNNLLSTYFASYPSAGYNSFPAFPACSNVECFDSSCTTTMYKIGPDNAYKEFSFEMDRYYNGGTWNGADLTHQSGHCYGLSQVGARYLDKIGYTYEEILDTFYFDYSLASMLNQNGLSSTLTDISWYTIRTDRTGITSTKYWKDNNIFYQSSASLMGQCTWYAHGRAKEILETALINGAITEEEYQTSLGILNKLSRNANMWWTINRQLGDSGFSSSTDEPQIGSLVVFDGVSTASVNGYSCGQYYNAGHVGVVENVYYDEYGNWTGLWISDGWKSDSCESTVCFQSKYWSRSEVENYRNGCRPLLGFIYLFNYEEVL